MISQELLKILCCPGCGGELVHDSRKKTLTCRTCAHVYRVEEDLPVMILDEKTEKP